jgi:hypothetical protein
MTFLHEHHDSKDRLLWPALCSRAPLKLAECTAVWRRLLLPHWTELALAGASSGRSVGPETCLVRPSPAGLV